MNTAKLKVRLWYMQQSMIYNEYELQTNINFEFIKYLGAREDRYLELSGYNCSPTGNYRVVINEQTPAELSNIYVNPPQVKDGKYCFTVHVGTYGVNEAVFKLGLAGKWKKFYERYARWLKNAGPYYWGEGIIGLIKGTFYGKFSKSAASMNTVNLGSMEFNIDKNIVIAQLLKDFSSYGLNQVYYEVDKEASDKNIEVKMDGSKLYATYIDKEPPLITDLLPARDVILIEDFQPALSAKFNDLGGSGININSFSLIIDESSFDNKIVVDRKTPGIAIDANGFKYMPGKKLDFGSHSIRLKIEDYHTRATEVISYFQITRFVPIIANVTPGNGVNITEPRPLISAQFIDNGKSGVDISTFCLDIDGSRQVKQGATGLVLYETGFAFTPLVNLQSGRHTLKIQVIDRAGNKSAVSSAFDVSLKPFNSAIGDLPVISLENVGAQTESTYITKAKIQYIKDLLSQDPRELSKLTGIPMRVTIDNVRRAQIACIIVRFKRMNFGELFDKSVYDIGCMSDKEILDYDQSIDANGNPVTESSLDLADLRQNIDLLFVCIDDDALMKLRFGTIIFNQPEGCY